MAQLINIGAAFYFPPVVSLYFTLPSSPNGLLKTHIYTSLPIKMLWFHRRKKNTLLRLNVLWLSLRTCSKMNLWTQYFLRSDMIFVRCSIFTFPPNILPYTKTNTRNKEAVGWKRLIVISWPRTIKVHRDKHRPITLKNYRHYLMGPERTFSCSFTLKWWARGSSLK